MGKHAAQLRAMRDARMGHLENIYADPANAELVKTLKAEMYRLKKELKDEDQFDKELPKDNVDNPGKKKK